MLTPGADLGAASYRIPNSMSPFNLGPASHIYAFCENVIKSLPLIPDFFDSRRHIDT